MCFYDQTRWGCGEGKWGNFRAHCLKEHRIGETCGMKLVNETLYVPGVCDICAKIETKRRRIDKEERNICRWASSGRNWSGNIERAQELISEMELRIRDFESQRARKARDLR